MRLGRLLANAINEDDAVIGVDEEIVNCSDLLHSNFTTNFSATVDTAEDPIVVINCTTYSINNGNNTTDLMSSSGGGLDLGNILITTLSGFLFLLCCCTCLRPQRPNPEVVRRMAAQRERVRQFEELRKDPNWQKKAMSKYLTTKEVLSFDERDQTLTLGDVDDDDDGGGSMGGQSLSLVSVESNEDTSHCVICLEAFRVGDRVTFPFGDSDCRHVFHNECIVSWFEKHNDCPSCRSVLLHVGEGDELLVDDSEAEELDDDDDPMNAGSSAFVIVGGLIRKVTNSASSCFIGNSIDVETGGGDGGRPELRRTLSGGYSLERRPSFLRVALRRISSFGKYSRLSQNFDDDAFDDVLDDDEDSLEETELGLKQPQKLKRTLSEGASLEQPARRRSFFEQVGLRRVSSSGGYARVGSSSFTSLQDEEDDIELARADSMSSIGTGLNSLHDMGPATEGDDFVLEESPYGTVRLTRRVSFEDQRMREQLANPALEEPDFVAMMGDTVSPEMALKPIHKMSEDDRRLLSVRSPTILEEEDTDLDQLERQEEEEEV